MTCDCPTILANEDFYEAAVAYDDAAIASDTSHKNADSIQLMYWNSQVQACGCTDTAALEPTAVVAKPTMFTPEQLHQFAIEREELRLKHLNSAGYTLIAK